MVNNVLARLRILDFFNNRNIFGIRTVKNVPREEGEEEVQR